MADGGIENFNGEVDALVGSGMLNRVRALVDIRISNSMIESWWSKLKRQWLFLHRLESGKRAARARRLKVNRTTWCERCRDLPGSVM